MSLSKGEVCYFLAGILSERNVMVVVSVTPGCLCSILISGKEFVCESSFPHEDSHTVWIAHHLATVVFLLTNGRYEHNTLLHLITQIDTCP